MRIKELITFWQNSNKLKNERKLGSDFKDLNTAGAQTRIAPRMIGKQDTVHLKSCAEGQRNLSHFLRKIIFYCCEVVQLIA